MGKVGEGIGDLAGEEVEGGVEVLEIGEVEGERRPVKRLDSRRRVRRWGRRLREERGEVGGEVVEGEVEAVEVGGEGGGRGPERELWERKRSFREAREERLAGRAPERWLCFRLRTRRLGRPVRAARGPRNPRPSRTMWETRLFMQLTPYQLEHGLVVFRVHVERLLLGSELEDLKAIRGFRSGCWEVEMESVSESVRRKNVMVRLSRLTVEPFHCSTVDLHSVKHKNDEPNSPINNLNNAEQRSKLSVSPNVQKDSSLKKCAFSGGDLQAHWFIRGGLSRGDDFGPTVSIAS
ncbi:hypothetical protein Sjap_014896 [Stephania japonica]|uniref:Uncharacterized protein n=1 Tax=Stephania japonica TaxID=461633 RepID=A0AAP0II45_9MAGN